MSLNTAKICIKTLESNWLVTFSQGSIHLKLLFNYQKWIFLIENKIKKNVSLGHWIKKFVLIIFVLVGRALLLWLVEWNLTYQNQPEWFFLDDIHIASDWWHFSAITPTPTPFMKIQSYGSENIIYDSIFWKLKYRSLKKIFFFLKDIICQKFVLSAHKLISNSIVRCSY